MFLWFFSVGEQEPLEPEARVWVEGGGESMEGFQTGKSATVAHTVGLVGRALVMGAVEIGQLQVCADCRTNRRNFKK